MWDSDYKFLIGPKKGMRFNSNLSSLFSLILVCASATWGWATDSDLRLWYNRPAEKWEEALPVGSGRLGAMVFGGVEQDRIQFNEDTLWTGKPHDYVRVGAVDHLDQVRQLIFQGSEDSLTQAQNIFRTKMLSDPMRQKAYQPFGNLRFGFLHDGQATNYRRELNLNTATVTTRYKVGDTTFTRQVIASYPDNVIAIRIQSSQPGKVNFTVKMDSPHVRSETKSGGESELVLTGQVHDPVALKNLRLQDPTIKDGQLPEATMGLTFCSRLRLIALGGKCSSSSDSLKVTQADSVVLLLVAATSFVNFNDVSGDSGARCDDYLQALQGKTFDQLLDRHIADHQTLFNRVSLDLGRNELADLPTDQRIEAFKKQFSQQWAAKPIVDSKGPQDSSPRVEVDPKKVDVQLATLFFQYGRYMLIAASRPKTQPANLQGVWNDSLDPPWESKYTTNINVQMNYWPAELTNLAECHEPLFDMIDDLRISGNRTAQKMYRARGWVVHHNTDIWRGTAPINNIDGMWTTGAAWLCHHLWEHYQFSGDQEFLRTRAYPAMKEACLFLLDTLQRDPTTGWLVTNPSHSPEQTPPGRPLFVRGAAMDMQLVRAVFDYTIEAAGILKTDSEFVQQLSSARAELAPDQIGREGQLQEWLDDWDAPNNNHRHMSPLWGLYPGSQFHHSSDPKVFAAAKKLLAWRGDGSTGWSFAWRIPLWARVGDGEMAYRQLGGQLSRRVLPNLFDLCGPFQADGNYGAAAGIAEMLVQSHTRSEGEYVVEFLPAISRVWREGSVKGLRVRGGFEVSFAWKDNQLTAAEIHSTSGARIKLKTRRGLETIQCAPGQTIKLDSNLRVGLQ